MDFMMLIAYWFWFFSTSEQCDRLYCSSSSDMYPTLNRPMYVFTIHFHVCRPPSLVVVGSKILHSIWALG